MNQGTDEFGGRSNARLPSRVYALEILLSVVAARVFGSHEELEKESAFIDDVLSTVYQDNSATNLRAEIAELHLAMDDILQSVRTHMTQPPK